MIKPVLAVDIDDVLVPHEVLLAGLYRKQIDKQYAQDSMTGYHAGDLSDDIRRKTVELMTNYINSDDFFETKPIKEAGSVLKDLKKHYKLVIASARPGSIKDKTEKWLEQHFPQIFEDVQFIYVERWGHGPTSSKVSVLKQLDAKILIDDNLRHISMAAAEGIEGVLFGNYSWNQTEELPENVVRAENWPAVLKLLVAGGLT